MVSITIPEKMSEEIDAIIGIGYYDNRSEFIREAIRSYLTQKPEIRLVAAIELYRDGKITISRAAEIAGIPFDRMKEIFQDEGILQRGRFPNKRDNSELKELIS